MNGPLYYHELFPLFLVIFLVPKSTLLGVNIATLTFFSLVFACVYLSFKLYASLDLKQDSYRQHIVKSCFFTQNDNLYFLIGVFRPFIFN